MEISTRLLLEIADRAGLALAYADAVQLEHRADSHFDRLIEAISSAEREICVEMYQVESDAVGTRVIEALMGAARRGRDVRVLLDAFGSTSVAETMNDMRQAGVDARWYSPFGLTRSPWRRTHRKLVIIDGTTSTIGGINLCERFSERHSGARAWRDVGVWIKGPVSGLLRTQFEQAWKGERGRELPHIPTTRSSRVLCAMAGGPDGRQGHAAAYRALAQSAKRELLLATPYFVPDVAFREALKSAVGRGVRVVVTTPRQCDIPWFKHAGRRIYTGLLQSGVEIRERCDRMVHAKVAVVDRQVAAMGSVNLNGLSFFNNSETLLLTNEPTAVSEMYAFFEHESAKHAEPLHLTTWSRHPDRRRWAELVSLTACLL